MLKSRKSWFRQVARHEQVRALHNFLVGQDRIVVHNGYIRADIDDLRAKYKNNPQGIDEIADPFTKEVVQMSDEDYALLREDLYFAVGTITDPVLGSNLFPVFRLDWGSAWKALSDLPPSVKTDVFNLETVSRHLDDTGKLADDVAAEIAQSGSYTKWLSDHFVTYIKNGFRIDKPSIDFQFANHLDVVESVSSNLVKGGHNKTQFFTKVYDPITNPNQRVSVLNQQNLGQPGWSLIEYKTYKVDAAGNLLTPLQLNSGNSAFKTVYDPSIVSQASLKDAGYKAFKDAIDNNTTGINFPNDFDGVADGVVYTGFFDQGSKTIINWYVK